MNRQLNRGYALILTAFFLLFCFRVGAQLIQAWFPVDVLPPFDAWASGAMPYWLLCVSQAIIIIVCARVIWRLYVGTVIPSAKMGKILILIGGLYLGLMCVRLIIGLTVGRDHFWFGAKLPTLFHLVLACFMMVYGRFHAIASCETSAVESRGMA